MSRRWASITEEIYPDTSGLLVRPETGGCLRDPKCQLAMASPEHQASLGVKGHHHYGCPKHRNCRFWLSSATHQATKGKKDRHAFPHKRCDIEVERSDRQIAKAIPEHLVKAHHQGLWRSIAWEIASRFVTYANGLASARAYLEAMATTNFERASMTSRPTNQILMERTGLGADGVRYWRRQFEKWGLIRIVARGRSRGYASSGGNEAQVYVLTLPKKLLAERAEARSQQHKEEWAAMKQARSAVRQAKATMARVGAAAREVVDKFSTPTTSSGVDMNTPREGDTPNKDSLRETALWSANADGATTTDLGVFGAFGGGSAPGVATVVGADAHQGIRGSRGSSRAGRRFDADLQVAAEWLRANIPAFHMETIGWVRWAIKAKVRCGWSVPDIIHALDWREDGTRYPNKALDKAKHPARAARGRLDAWGTRSARQKEADQRAKRQAEQTAQRAAAQAEAEAKAAELAEREARWGKGISARQASILRAQAEANNFFSPQNQSADVIQKYSNTTLR